MPSFSYRKQVKIVITTKALHNYIRRYATNDHKFKKYLELDVELEDEEDGDVTSIHEHLTHRTRGMESVRNNIASSLMGW